MTDLQAQRKRAIHFTDQLKSALDKAFDDSLNWEADSPPSIKFVINKQKRYEMRLEYNATEDIFQLYDSDAKSQRNETLGKYSPANIMNPNDDILSKIVDAVTKYIRDHA